MEKHQRKASSSWLWKKKRRDDTAETIKMVEEGSKKVLKNT